MSEKRFTTQRIYKGFDGEKIYEWCVMDYDNVLLRLTTRMDCKDVCEELNNLHEENRLLKGRIQEYEEIIGGYIDENEEIRKKMNVLHEENEYLKRRLRDVSNELYCKDRTLEALGQSIECCDRND